ncbi:MAG: OsmC family protein [Candidatus Sulfotelmatobacter sp.]
MLRELESGNAGGNHTVEQAEQFRVLAWWSSGRSGIAQSDSAPNTIHFASPPAFGGMDGRWTPEDLLLGAIASSYTTTFRTLAENAKFEHTDFQVEIEGVVKNAPTGYSFTEIAIRAHLVIPDETERSRALKLLNTAKNLCLVSRALAVQQVFEPVVAVAVPIA